MYFQIKLVNYKLITGHFNLFYIWKCTKRNKHWLTIIKFKLQKPKNVASHILSITYYCDISWWWVCENLKSHIMDSFMHYPTYGLTATNTPQGEMKWERPKNFIL
jgi:hypothetical protein